MLDFTNLIERRPIDPEAYNYRGQCHYSLGEFERAIADYTTAIDQAPNYLDAYSHRAAAYAASRQTDLAVLDFSKVIAMQPNHLSALSARALCNFELGRIERARADVELLRNLGGQVDPEFAKKLSVPRPVRINEAGITSREDRSEKVTGCAALFCDFGATPSPLSVPFRR